MAAPERGPRQVLQPPPDLDTPLSPHTFSRCHLPSSRPHHRVRHNAPPGFRVSGRHPGTPDGAQDTTALGQSPGPRDRLRQGPGRHCHRIGRAAPEPSRPLTEERPSVTRWQTRSHTRPRDLTAGRIAPPVLGVTAATTRVGPGVAPHAPHEDARLSRKHRPPSSDTPCHLVPRLSPVGSEALAELASGAGASASSAPGRGGAAPVEGTCSWSLRGRSGPSGPVPPVAEAHSGMRPSPPHLSGRAGWAVSVRPLQGQPQGHPHPPTGERGRPVPVLVTRLCGTMAPAEPSMRHRPQGPPAPGAVSLWRIQRPSPRGPARPEQGRAPRSWEHADTRFGTRAVKSRRAPPFAPERGSLVSRCCGGGLRRRLAPGRRASLLQADTRSRERGPHSSTCLLAACSRARASRGPGGPTRGLRTVMDRLAVSQASPGPGGGSSRAELRGAKGATLSWLPFLGLPLARPHWPHPGPPKAHRDAMPCGPSQGKN